MSFALPPAPSPAQPRTMLMATALGVAGAAMAFAGLIGVYLTVRDAAGGTTATWWPQGVVVPEVATNIMLITMVSCSIMVQWAVWAMGQDNRRDTLVALGLTVLFGLAVVNAQIYVWTQLALPPVSESALSILLYAVTATFIAALVIGLMLAIVVVFRSMGGRYDGRHHEGITSLALYWHFLTVAFAAVWLAIYVTK